MTRGTLIFLLLIPAFIALGHDIYLFYVNYIQVEGFDMNGFTENFKFSALGFILTTYAEDWYKELVRVTEPDIWKTVDLFLTVPAFYAGLFFAAIMTFIYILFGLFGLGPFAAAHNQGHSASSGSSFRAGDTKKKFEYKRK